jgi:hypothetical protein
MVDVDKLIIPFVRPSITTADGLSTPCVIGSQPEKISLDTGAYLEMMSIVADVTRNGTWTDA